MVPYLRPIGKVSVTEVADLHMVEQFKKRLEVITKKRISYYSVKQLNELMSDISDFTVKYLIGTKLFRGFNTLFNSNYPFYRRLLYNSQNPKKRIDQVLERNPIAIKYSFQEFYPRLNKWLISVESFLFQHNPNSETDIQFIDHIFLSQAGKLNRRIVGNGYALILGQYLEDLHRQMKIKSPKNDDIKELAISLRKTKMPLLKKFLLRNHNKFAIADSCRNDSTHPRNNPPSNTDLRQIRELAIATNKFLTV